MPRLEHRADLPAAPGAVWAIIGEPARLGDWLTMHQGWVGPPPVAFAPGAAVTARALLAGLPVTVTWTVDRFTAPRVLAFHGNALGQVDVGIEVELEAASGGTSLVIGVELDGPLLAGPIGAALERAGRDELAHSVDRLRELLAAT